MSIVRLEDIHVPQWLGKLIAVAGPMRSAKTKDRRDFLCRIRDHTPHNARSFIPLQDTRTVSSLDRERGFAYLASAADRQKDDQFPAFVFDDPNEILSKLEEEDHKLSSEGSYVEVIDIEEPMFCDHRLIGVLRELTYFKGKPRLVIAGGLNKDFRKEAFRVMGWIVANADCVVYRHSCCGVVTNGGIQCGRPDAQYTIRLLNMGKTGFKGPELQVRGKNGGTLRGFTPAPFFDPTYRPEIVASKDAPEEDLPFVYSVACVEHYPSVPFMSETLAVHRFALERALSEGRGMRRVLLTEIENRFSETPHLEAIISFLSERGMKKEGNVLVPQNYYKGEYAGLYVNQADFINKEGKDGKAEKAA